MSLKTFGSRSFAALTFGALTLAGISAAAAQQETGGGSWSHHRAKRNYQHRQEVEDALRRRMGIPLPVQAIIRMVAAEVPVDQPIAVAEQELRQRLVRLDWSWDAAYQEALAAYREALLTEAIRREAIALDLVMVCPGSANDIEDEEMAMLLMEFMQ